MNPRIVVRIHVPEPSGITQESGDAASGGRPLDPEPDPDGALLRSERPAFLEKEAREGPLTTAANEVDSDSALAIALGRASAAGRWDLVAQLARDLEARRLSGSNAGLGASGAIKVHTKRHV